MDHVLKRSLPGTQPRVQIVFPAIVISISICLMMSVFIHPVQADETSSTDSGLDISGNWTNADHASSASSDYDINALFSEMKKYPNLDSAASFNATPGQLIQHVKNRNAATNASPEEQDGPGETGESEL